MQLETKDTTVERFEIPAKTLNNSQMLASCASCSECIFVNIMNIHEM